ncbi:MAG: hypothetical protein methR_P3812 [Methyloprofundus sp.]|nr:MAG: hypothetical protein methR_P3812 [Methyloprofundus sp.]
MDIFILYIIKTLLLPLASLLIISIIGILLIRRKPLIAQKLLSFSLGTLLLLSMPIVAKHLAASQEIYPPLDKVAIHDFAAQAIVVLGGGLREPAPEYQQLAALKSGTLERVRYAAKIAKQTQLPILTTGGKVFDSDLPSEAELMAKVLTDEFGQPVHWQEENSRNTAENASYTQDILIQEGISRIILVTHAYHMQRAVKQFQGQGFQVLPAPTVLLAHSDTLNILSFLPSASALQKSTLTLHEIMGIIWYELRY